LKRQQLVCRYLLRGLTVPEVAKHLGVTERTIQLDFQEIKASLFQVIQTRELRSLKLALLELDELWREGWLLYHRPARRESDDRGIKAMLLMDLLHISAEKNRLLIPTDAKNLAILEPRKPGIMIERLTFEEQMARGVDELKNNEGLRRSEGILDDDL
jgi:transcriptional antiterminator